MVSNSNIVLITIAFIVAIVLIVWGFHAVDKANIPNSEKWVWKDTVFVNAHPCHAAFYFSKTGTKKLKQGLYFILKV